VRPGERRLRYRPGRWTRRRRPCSTAARRRRSSGWRAARRAARRRCGSGVTSSRGRSPRAGWAGCCFGYDETLSRKLAIKLWRPQASRGEDLRARMLREAQALARLSHPNVVHVYEVGDHRDLLYLAMEYVEGRTLREWVKQDRPELPRIVERYVQAGQGLAAAHRAGGAAPRLQAGQRGGRRRRAGAGPRLRAGAGRLAHVRRDSFAGAGRAVAGGPGGVRQPDHAGGLDAGGRRRTCPRSSWRAGTRTCARTSTASAWRCGRRSTGCGRSRGRRWRS
jgi:hypothetical protein